MAPKKSSRDAAKRLTKAGLVPAFQVFKEKGGYNADIHYEVYPDGRISVVARYGAKKGGLTHGEAQEVHRDLLQYQEELTRRSVPLPDIERLMVEEDRAAGRAIVIKASPWTGKDLHCLIRDADHKKDRLLILGYVRQICKVLSPVCRDRLVGWETNVGIDPRCSNFTVDERGRIAFVDLFPPRYRRHGQPILEWPEPKNPLGRELGYFKHYDVRGIILCTTAQLARVKPELKPEMEEETHRGLKNAMTAPEYKAFKNELDRTPWYRLRQALKTKDRAAALAAIKGASDAMVFGVRYNVYTLRELALECGAAGLLDRAGLEAFFLASHFEDELPKAKLAQLERTLINIVTKKP